MNGAEGGGLGKADALPKRGRKEEKPPSAANLPYAPGAEHPPPG